MCIRDRFEVLKTTVLLQKVHHLDAMALQPEDALVMACRDGAQTYGAPDELGAITVGRKADLVLVNLDSVFIGPVHRVPSALVFNATPADVRDVWVDGRRCIADYRSTIVDERELLAAARTAAGRVFERAGVSSRLTSG